MNPYTEDEDRAAWEDIRQIALDGLWCIAAVAVVALLAGLVVGWVS
jgi:hypothetical protein